MPKISEKDRVGAWMRKIHEATKEHRDWSEKYQTKRMLDYYYGHQWDTPTPVNGQEPYVINLIFSGVEVKRPSLAFPKPKFTIRPKQTRTDDPASMSEGRAKLLEDTLNTFVLDQALNFEAETSLGVFEAFFSFAVAEVGYTADFIDNPNAGKPVIKDGKEMVGSDDNPVLEPEQVMEGEMLFIKRIPASAFRVSMPAKNELKRNDWCGYFEWHYPEDIRANKRYKNVAMLQNTGKLKTDTYDGDSGAGSLEDEETRRKGMVRIWKIWDMRAKKRLTIAEGHEKFLLEEPYEFLPLATLKFHERLDEFYPLPPSFNWRSPQDELNETREQQRKHRRRFDRKFLAIEGRITVEEVEKLRNGGDGTIVTALQERAIQAVEDAPLDGAIVRNIPQSKADFDLVSGTTAEAQGIPETATATQSNILDSRQRIRETLQRNLVGVWLAEIGKLLLLTIQKRMALPFWIKTNVDPFSPGALAEVQDIAEKWTQITSSQLGPINYDVSIEVESSTPVTEATEKQTWTNALGIILDPNKLMLLAGAPGLLRRTAHVFGIRNEKEIQEIQKLGETLIQLQVMQLQAAQGSKPGAGSPGPAPQGAAPAPTPTNLDTQGQLAAQMGGPQ